MKCNENDEARGFPGGPLGMLATLAGLGTTIVYLTFTLATGSWLPMMYEPGPIPSGYAGIDEFANRLDPTGPGPVAGTAHLIAISDMGAAEIGVTEVKTLHLVRVGAPVVRVHLDAPVDTELEAHLRVLTKGSRLTFSGVGHGDNKQIEVYPAHSIDGLTP